MAICTEKDMKGKNLCILFVLFIENSPEVVVPLGQQVAL